MIFMTMSLPISGVAWRDAQIDRLTIHRHSPLNDSRLSIEHPWLRVIADINLAIKAGLTDVNRNTNIGSECRNSESGSGEYR
jgi:molybdenum cofactor biosynthesis enzyme MoaA